MAQRGITRADIEGVLRRPVNGPLPGDGGHLIFEEFASHGRLLRVTLSSNRETVMSAMWRG